MRTLMVLGLAIAACGSPTGGDDGTTPDADPGMPPSMCTNYTPPALPDSQLVWHDAVALTANDFTVDFTYDSAGRLTRRQFDAAGATLDTTDDFTYTSAGKLSRWDHQA